jgi:hypothetical protein
MSKKKKKKLEKYIVSIEKKTPANIDIVHRNKN